VKKKSINLITMGCSKNLVDSEKILGQLLERNYSIKHDSDEPADIVVINTCGFINDAKQESIDAILGFAEARKRGDVGRLYVIGCLSQRYREDLAKEIPEVDAWFGVEESYGLFRQLRERYDYNSHVRAITTPSHYAYLKISEGCDRTCSFCAIPLIRGKHRSTPVADLVHEASALASKGVKELILVAQDLSYYGRDIAGKPLLLPLIESLLEIGTFEWIRLHYLYPKAFPEEIIPLMAGEPRICNYIDMPLQHINDGILRSMRRGHDKEGTLALIRRLREQLPGLAFRTTMMVGYPGETAAIYEELKAFIQEARFERLGVFAYSAEEGTGAYALHDEVPEKEKQRRASEIMAIQRTISEEINQERIGQTFRVIVDRREAGYFAGRTEYDSPEVDNEVILPGSADISVGDFVMARVTSATDFDLYAEISEAE